jgi:hypothetical protein
MAKIRPVIILSAAIIAIACNVNGESYSWTDSSGAIHFTDDPGSIPTKYRHKVNVRESIAGTPAYSPPVEQSQKIHANRLSVNSREGGKDAARKRDLEHHRQSLKQLENKLSAVKDELMCERRNFDQMPHTGTQTVRATRENRKKLQEINSLEAQIATTKAKIRSLE